MITRMRQNSCYIEHWYDTLFLLRSPNEAHASSQPQKKNLLINLYLKL